MRAHVAALLARARVVLGGAVEELARVLACEPWAVSGWLWLVGWLAGLGICNFLCRRIDQKSS
jgi:hypothetical protein